MDSIKTYLIKNQVKDIKNIIDMFISTAEGLNNHYAANDLKHINKLLDLINITLEME